MRLFVAALLLPAAFAQPNPAELGRSLREAGLEASECYRVHELTFAREDVRLFFTDGYLVFGQPVGGNRISAVFTTDIEGGDAEILIMPPTRAERKSLAQYAGTPNLDEHFTTAVLLFAGNTYQELLEQIRANPLDRKSPEMGALLAERWSPVVRNLAAGFETRLVLELLSGETGFLAAAIEARKTGNFNVLYDPRGQEQVLLGRVAARENRTYFDVWTSFPAASFRKRHISPGPEFAIHGYRIDAALDPELKLAVTTRIRIAPNSAARVLPFDITPAMHIVSAAVDGTTAGVLQRESLRSNFASGNELFLIVPPEPLAAGRDYEIEVRHEGKVIADAGNHVYYVGSRGNWYPSRGVQFANYDVTFRYPHGLDLVMPGDVQSDAVEGEVRITRRVIPTPIRMAGFNLGVYEHERVAREGNIVEVYANRSVETALQPRPQVTLLPPVPMPGRRRSNDVASPAPPAAPLPPNPLSRLHELAAEIAGAMDYMSARFGSPALRSVMVSPIPGTFGQGFPGMIYLSTLSYLAPRDKPVAALPTRQQAFFTEILHAHETAHQWWGNVVTSAGYHDDWLMESLANYSALMYLEKRKGARLLDEALDDYRHQLLANSAAGAMVEASGPVVMGTRLESSHSPGVWRSIVYGKGSWIIHMLRRRMGDERFQGMLAAVRREYDRKPLSTEDFRRIAARFLPPKSEDPELEAFFDQWVYGTGIPALRLNYSVKGRAPAIRVVGTVQQSEVDRDFTAVVPVEIQLGRGKSITKWVQTGESPAEFTVALKQAPVRVVLDPHSSILRR